MVVQPFHLLGELVRVNVVLRVDRIRDVMVEQYGYHHFT